MQPQPDLPWCPAIRQQRRSCRGKAGLGCAITLCLLGSQQQPELPLLPGGQQPGAALNGLAAISLKLLPGIKHVDAWDVVVDLAAALQLGTLAQLKSIAAQGAEALQRRALPTRPLPLMSPSS